MTLLVRISVFSTAVLPFPIKIRFLQSLSTFPVLISGLRRPTFDFETPCLSKWQTGTHTCQAPKQDAGFIKPKVAGDRGRKLRHRVLSPMPR